MRIENISIDEMARDARTLAGPRGDWGAKFRQLLACYGWRVEREGGVIHTSKGPILCDWEIVRC